LASSALPGSNPKEKGTGQFFNLTQYPEEQFLTLVAFCDALIEALAPLES